MEKYYWDTQLEYLKYSDMNQQNKQKLFHSLKEDGVGGEPVNKSEFIESLQKRGIIIKEAHEQFEAELLFSQIFNIDSSFIYAPSMKITFGEIKK